MRDLELENLRLKERVESLEKVLDFWKKSGIDLDKYMQELSGIVNSSQNQKSSLEILSDEFSRRVKANPQFSLRAFAALLDMSSGHMSEILKGKRLLSNKLSKKIAKKLFKNISEQERFIEISVIENDNLKVVEDYIKKSFVRKINLFNKIEKVKTKDVTDLSDWYYFALLSLIDTKDFKLNHQWISGKLNITVEEVKEALRRLECCKLIQISGDSVVLDSSCTFSINRSSEVRKELHLNILSKASSALEGYDKDKLNFGWYSIATTHEKVSQVEKILVQNLSELALYLEDVKNPNDVYMLSLQLFPVSNEMSDGIQDNKLSESV